MQPETRLFLRKRWSLKGNGVLLCIMLATLPAIPATAIGAFALRRGMPGTADTVTMLIAAFLTAILIAIAVRIALKPVDLLITSRGLEIVGLRTRRYNWNELTKPKFTYIRNASGPGRCIEMRFVAPAHSRTAPIRVFDWYNVEFDHIKSFIAAACGSEIGPSATNMPEMPLASRDRAKPRLTLIKTAVLFALALFSGIQALDLFGLAEPIRAFKVDAVDLFDPRPTKTILIVGNSRTSDNNMPAMVRAIADADQFPEKIHFKMATVNGSTLETVWGTSRLQTLLAARYDGAIVQGESRAQSNDILAASYLVYGQKLLLAIKLRSDRPRLIVNWTYDPILYQAGGANREEHFERMQHDQLRLAERTGAQPVNIGMLWERVHTVQPQIALTTDGNHPTLAGSYLFALLIYGDFSKRRVAKNTFVPDGLAQADAAALRDSVEDFLQRRA